MDLLIYYAARLLLGILQSFPLTWVARLGRAGGGLACRIDARHRRVAIKNLEMCFGGEKSPEEIRALAHENFRRIGESYVCALKTAFMDRAALAQRIELAGREKIIPPGLDPPASSLVFAIGPF